MAREPQKNSLGIMTNLLIATSTVADGSMKSPDQNYATVLPARTAFLSKSTIVPKDVTLVQVTYRGDDYCRYATLAEQQKGDGITYPSSIESDALVVTQPGHALFLPLADCVGAAIHDTKQDILMLSHLGRHNLEQFGGARCIGYLMQHHHSQLADLAVWLSPAAGKASYPLYAFENRSLHDVAIEQLTNAGVSIDKIAASPIDSATDEHYFSHSQYLKGLRQSDGRFAVVAMMQ